MPESIRERDNQQKHSLWSHYLKFSIDPVHYLKWISKNGFCTGAVVVAQLAERAIPTPEVRRVLKKWANPGLFFVYFQSFSNKQYNFYKKYVKKCPSSIRCRDSNPRPLKREAFPITTRPGLPPFRRVGSKILQLTYFLKKLGIPATLTVLGFEPHDCQNMSLLS